MQPTLAPLSLVFALNTRLFHNCLVDFGEDAAAARLGPTTNSPAFIAAHLVDSRAWLARFIGLEEPKPFAGALEYGKTIDELPRVPALAESREIWDGVSQRVEHRLVWMTADELAAATDTRFPGVPGTVLGGLAFLIQHESYHIGQLALLRKHAGLPAMAYR